MSSGPREGAPDEPDDQWHDAEGGGWIPPERRTWRHPSELHAPALSAVSLRPSDRRVATLSVATVAVAAIVVGLILLMNTGARPGATLDQMPVGTGAATPCCRLSAVVARDDEEAVVALGTHGKVSGCGVVVADGELVATTSRVLDGAKRLQATTATGHSLTATLVGADPVSGVALLRLTAVLPSAHVGSSNAIGTGSPAMSVALSVPAGPRSVKPRAVWTSGTIVSTARPLGTDSASMATIAVRGASVSSLPGEPLVDASGAVVGILDASMGSERGFLPMTLVIDVARDIDVIGHVRHGWLDVNATTPPGSDGATVVSVKTQGASSAALRPGDVIVALDGQPITSSAQLRSLLYALAPGTQVTLSALRDGRKVSRVVSLSASP